MNYASETPEKLPKETQSLYETLAQIPDPRSRRVLRYPLAMILTVVVLAKLSGESELRGIAQWARYRADALRQAFGAAQGRAMPHWTTCSRVLSQVDEQDLARHDPQRTQSR